MTLVDATSRTQWVDTNLLDTSSEATTSVVQEATVVASAVTTAATRRLQAQSWNSASSPSQTTAGSSWPSTTATTTSVISISQTTALVGDNISGIIVTGHCVSYRNGHYSRAGFTKSGAPYFKHVISWYDYYVYYEPDCSGTSTWPRWVLTLGAPDLTALYNLDGNGECDYLARIYDFNA